AGRGRRPGGVRLGLFHGGERGHRRGRARLGRGAAAPRRPEGPGLRRGGRRPGRARLPQMTADDGERLAERLATVQAGVADAARAAGRRVDELTTIVVTKFHPARLVRELYGLGVRDFGENRHQEARAKAEGTADLDAVWHFVGQLQSNKARQARGYASVIHSVDRASLVDALASDDGEVGCFLQVNL